MVWYPNETLCLFPWLFPRKHFAHDSLGHPLTGGVIEKMEKLLFYVPQIIVKHDAQ